MVLARSGPCHCERLSAMSRSPRQPEPLVQRARKLLSARDSHQFFVYMERDLVEASDTAPPPGLDIHRPSPEELDEANRRHPKSLPDRKHAILRERLKEPDRGVWIITMDGTFAGYCCAMWSRGLSDRIQRAVPAGPEDVHLFDTFVGQRFRRRGVHLASIEHRCREAQARGARRANAVIAAGNAASRGAFAKAGFETRHALSTSTKAGVSVRVPLWVANRAN